MVSRNIIIEQKPELKNKVVEWLEPGCVLISNGHNLTWSTSIDKSPTYQLEFPQPLWRRCVSSIRPAQRLLRNMFYNCIPLSDGMVFSTFGRESGLLSEGAFQSIIGLRFKTRVLRGGVCRDKEGDLYFGEYSNNKNRDTVCIYRLPLGSNTVEVAYIFQAGEIRHIHGVYHDPYDDSLWCLTGDRGKECKIVRSTNGFRSIDVVGEGDESWRSVSLQFTNEGIYYATDAEFENNHIYRIDRVNGSRENLSDIDGPVYYSTKCGESLLFGVAAEMCPSQEDENSSIWKVDYNQKPVKVWSHEKDFLSPKYFLRGLIHFSNGPGLESSAYFHTVALKGIDNTNFKVICNPGNN